jgi:hypothetical protein
MPPPTEYRVSTLTGFTERIEEILSASQALYPTDTHVVNWYRGCGRSSYPLSPSLYRHPKIKDVDKLLVLEKEMLAWFKRESILHQTLKPYIDADFEHLFFMQHYSVPTRLLDWTGNPFIALYFALTRAHFDIANDKYEEDAAVWVLNPNSWNEKALSKLDWKAGALALEDSARSGYAPRKTSEHLDLRAMHESPAAMHGIANSSRMFAQKGVFTIFGRKTDPMEKIFEDDGYVTESLTKLTIDKSEIKSLLKSVLSIGYTDSVSYPDLHGLAMEIKRTVGF